MALHPTTDGLRSPVYLDLLRVVLFVAAIVALMIVATAVFGVNQTGPSYDIVPDPAGILPF